MRVAIVLGRNGLGGSESQTKILVRGLVAAGSDVDVILIEGDGGTDGFAPADVHVLLPRRQGGIVGFIKLIGAMIALRRRLRGNRYDVAHAIMARAYVLVPFATALSWRRPRIVAWRRNEGIHLRKRSIAAGIERIASRMTDHIICNSNSVRKYWIDRGYVRLQKSTVVPNALEQWRFEQSDDTIAVRHVVGRIVAVGV